MHYRQDVLGRDSGLHYLRTKDGAEVDFALSEAGQLTHLIECKLSEHTLQRALAGFALKFPEAASYQLVRDLRQEEQRANVRITDAAHWLLALDA